MALLDPDPHSLRGHRVCEDEIDANNGLASGRTIQLSLNDLSKADQGELIALNAIRQEMADAVGGAE